MKTKIVASLLIASFMISGCENPKEAMGTIGGGALGALAGSAIGGGSGRVVAIAVGGVLGAFAGNYLGKQLDNADKQKAAQAAQSCFEHTPQGQTSEWRNPDSGHSGTFTPVRTYKSSQGAYCREFQQTIVVGGKKENAYGTACRQPDGSWKIIQSQ